MVFNVHAGHNPDGVVACGAVCKELDMYESTQARKVKDAVISQLRTLGHTVYDCTVDNGTSSSDVLRKIVSKCNAHAVDYDISIHFNSSAKDKNGNGRTTGTEVLIYNIGDTKTKDVAQKICDEISSIGFKNRGVKQRKDLYVLNHTKAKALLIECCFVDDKDDVKLYKEVGYNTLASAIVRGLTGQVLYDLSSMPITPAPVLNGFLVKVEVKELNIRSGAGVEHKLTGCIKDKGTYTIVEIAKAKDGGTWGKLKSGVGWINISNKYVTRV